MKENKCWGICKETERLERKIDELNHDYVITFSALTKACHKIKEEIALPGLEIKDIRDIFI